MTTSMPASLRGLPTSEARRREREACSSRILFAVLRRTSARWRAGAFDQAPLSNAARAARMAASVSSSVALGQVATTSPLAGLRLSNVSPLLDATNSPLMRSWYVLPVMAWVAVSVAMEPPSKTWGDGTDSAIAHYSRWGRGTPERVCPALASAGRYGLRGRDPPPPGRPGRARC